MPAKIDQLFHTMMRLGASDLHLSVGFPPLVREHGHLVALQGAPVLTQQALSHLLHEIMRPDQKDIIDQNWDLDFAYSLAEAARFRANVFFDERGIGAVFRVIPTDIKSIEEMGYHPSVKRLAELEKGLVLVTGPTGSGKSTTLAAMVNHINVSRKGHIITIEDPIEFVHESKSCLMTQREVHYHTKSFANALKAACREDPDVILVGELRDLETIALSLTAAELGILVFGTLHTNSASKTVDRIIDAFPLEQQNQVRTMLADSLKGVIAQQLLRTKDGKGRCAAIEVMIGTPALGNIIREGKVEQLASMIQTGSNEGMVSMDKALAELYRKGKISMEDALSRAKDKNLFKDAT